LPPARQRAVPWTVLEATLVLGISVIVQWSIARILGASESLPADERAWRLLCTQLIAFPFNLAACVLVPWIISGAKPYQLGLTCHHIRQDIILGYLAWLLVTPAIYTLYGFVLHSAERVPHEVEQLVVARPESASWLVVLSVALLAAPVGEEIALRGLLQPSLIRQPLGCDLVILALLLIAVSFWTDRLLEGWAPEHAWFIAALLVLGPGYFGMDRLTRRRTEQNHASRGIFATSAVFAALHSWPSSVPLFVLALVLGWLRQRTQSLAAPITAHFLFNVVGLLPLMYQQLSPR
jgi:membrane protease YdiL (CAAX protease family)